MKKNRCVWVILLAALTLVFLGSLKQIFLLLLLLTACIPIVSALGNRLTARKLACSVQLTPTGEKGTALSGTVVLKNGSVFGVPCLKLCVSIQNLLTMGSQEQTFEFGLGGKKEHWQEITFSSAYCGCMQVKAETIQLFDIWGIFSQMQKIAGTGKVTIWPDTFSQQIAIGHRAAEEMDAVEYSQERPGSDPGEMFDIRDYIPGDRLSSIHWKLSGKYDKLMVVRPGLPLENSILLLFETGFAEAGIVTEAQLDAAAEVFVSLSQNLLADGRKHRVGWMNQFTGQFVTYDIGTEEDFIGLLPKLLSAGRGMESENAILHYEELHGDEMYAHIVYVAQTIPEGLHQFYDMSVGVTLLLADGSEAEFLTEHVQKIGFSERGYSRDLYDLMI